MVVDSLQHAITGGGERGDVAVPYTSLFNALRTLGENVTALILAHHSHAGDDRREAHPYGSRFIHNSCGARWELLADPEDATDTRPATLLQALYNRKMNDDAFKPSLALRIVFDRPGIRFESGDVKDSPALLEHATVRERIAAELAGGVQPDVATLAERTGASEPTVRKNLERFAGKDWVKLPGPKPALWVLRGYASR